MKLQEIFDQLGYGEFSQVSIGGQAAGVINEVNHKTVLGHLDLGLTALYTRFNLKERKLTIPLQPDADTYSLQVKDIIKIEKITTDAGVEVSLNLEGDPLSCFTPSLNSLRVPKILLDQDDALPEDLKTDGLTIWYRANHPKLSTAFGLMLPEMKEVELPMSHLQALLYFVASRVYNPIGVGQEFNAGNTWYGKYEGECQRLEATNIQVDRGFENTRLERAGWV